MLAGQVVASETVEVGTGCVLQGPSPNGAGAAVFEDDGDTGYFYALDTDGQSAIVDALHVYDIAAVREDFPKFEITRVHREFMHAPPLPIQGFPGASLLGWHLWVHLTPR